MTAPFTHRLRVRYHEADAQRNAFNARFLEYVDVALTEWLRSLGWDYPELVELGCDPSVVRAELEYFSPAVFDEELVIALLPMRVGSSSFTVHYRIAHADGGGHVATATVVYVNVDVDQRGSRPLPPPVAAAISRQAATTSPSR